MWHVEAVIGGENLRRTAKALREAGRTDLARGLQHAVRDAGQPTLDKVKQAARDIKVVGFPTGSAHRFVKPTKPKDLRQRIADASRLRYTATDTGATVSFRVYSSQMGGAKMLPRYIDLGERVGRGGWRHPIMGMRKQQWAKSEGKPWFFEPIKDSLPDFRKRIDEALDVMIAKVEGS